MHSIAIVLGLLSGLYGLACCVGVAWVYWLYESDPENDVLSGIDRWQGLGVAIAVLPLPLVVASGGAAAMYWGWVGG